MTGLSFDPRCLGCGTRVCHIFTLHFGFELMNPGHKNIFSSVGRENSYQRVSSGAAQEATRFVLKQLKARRDTLL